MTSEIPQHFRTFFNNLYQPFFAEMRSENKKLSQRLERIESIPAIQKLLVKEGL